MPQFTSLIADLRNNTSRADWLGAVVAHQGSAVQLVPLRIFASDDSLRELGTRFVRQGVWVAETPDGRPTHRGAVVRVGGKVGDENAVLTLRHDTTLPFLNPHEHEDVLLNALWAVIVLPHRPYFPYFALEKAVAALERHPSSIVRTEAIAAAAALSLSSLATPHQVWVQQDGPSRGADSVGDVRIITPV